MTLTFKPEVVIWSKLRMRTEKLPKWAKNSVGRLKILRHIWNRCRWIHFQWDIHDYVELMYLLRMRRHRHKTRSKWCCAPEM